MMNELKQIIIEEILANGPMPLENYMARALGDTAHGYYSKQDPLNKIKKIRGSTNFGQDPKKK